MNISESEEVELLRKTSLGPPYCSGLDPNSGYMCTRSPGHEGEHIAATRSTVRAVWPSVSNLGQPVRTPRFGEYIDSTGEVKSDVAHISDLAEYPTTEDAMSNMEREALDGV